MRNPDLQIFATPKPWSTGQAARFAATTFPLLLALLLLGQAGLTLYHAGSIGFSADSFGGLIASSKKFIIVSAILSTYLFLLLKLPSRLQYFAAWFTLFGLFLYFFFLFDLSYSTIAEKLPYLLSVGLFNTLFVSVLSISLATLFAILGAIAKLSGNGIAMRFSAPASAAYRKDNGRQRTL